MAFPYELITQRSTQEIGKKKRMAIKQEIVKLVLDRAAGYCETCGRSAAPSMALHHRKLKSRGGKDSASNLIWVHHECHNMGTEAIHMRPAFATDKGWMVSSWDDPEDTPFVRPDGSIVLLQNDGKITEVNRKEAL